MLRINTDVHFDAHKQRGPGIMISLSAHEMLAPRCVFGSYLVIGLTLASTTDRPLQHFILSGNSWIPARGGNVETSAF